LCSSTDQVESARVGMLTFRFTFVFQIAFTAGAFAQLPELRDLDTSGWDYLSKLEGDAITQDGKKRNQQKNRFRIDLAGLDIPSFETAPFLARVAHYDRQIEKKHRRDMNPEQKTKVAEFGRSTGWEIHPVMKIRGPGDGVIGWLDSAEALAYRCAGQTWT